MANSISVGCETTFYRFNISWALILFNIGIQHIIELRNQKDAPWEAMQLKNKASIILLEAVLICLNMFVYSRSGIIIAYVPILFGIISMMIFGNLNILVPVDFAHLSERAMLYVVFTFGEMIISSHHILKEK